MKTFLFVWLVLIAILFNEAHAGAFAYAPTVTGGKIILMTEQCAMPGGRQYVITTQWGQPVEYGCWRIVGKVVNAVDNDMHPRAWYTYHFKEMK